MDALVVEELSEVDDGRRVVGEEGCEPLGVPFVREPLVGVRRVRRVSAALRDESGERLVAWLRPPRFDVHARRHLVHAVDVAAHLLEHLPYVRGADEHGVRSREHLPPPRFELRPAAHRVLELGAVRLHRVARARGLADRAAEEHVVAEDEVGREALAKGARVRLDPAVELLARAVLEKLDLVALVVVEDEGREQPAHVRLHDLGRSQVVQLRMRLLTEHGHVVPRPRPLARELPRVHVRPRPAEQVPVPEEDAHACILLVRSDV